MEALSERLCGYFNGIAERLCDCLPETVGTVSPCAGIFRRGNVKTKQYVDGSSVVTVPFELRLRIRGVAVRDKLTALRYFDALTSYIKTAPLLGDGIVGVEAAGGCEKTDVFPNGEEEYRMNFNVKLKGE